MIVFHFFVFLFAATSFCDAAGSCENPDADVIILGAGMAGIAAASTLYNNSISNFLILEARDAIGGRMRAVEFGGIKIEAGANWIQGVDLSGSPREKVNPIWQLKQRCGLNGRKSDFSSRVVYENGVNITNVLRSNEYNSACERIVQLSTSRQAAGNRMPDISVREALSMSNWTVSSPGDNFIDWFGFDFCFAQPPRVSSLFQTRPLATYEDFGDDNFFVTDQRGYGHLVNCLSEDFLSQSPNRLRLNTMINRVEYTDDCVCAISDELTRFCGNYGIVTFPIGVLLNGSIVAFSPALPPNKTDAINMLSSALYLKIFLQFNETFWDKEVEIIGRSSSNREDYPVFEPLGKFFLSKPNIIFATLTGETAYRVAAQDRNVTRQELLNALRSMYPNFRAELVNMFIPDWASNPLYLGSYSNTKVGVTDQTYADLAAPLGRLYFSGEATSNKYNGFVHGAYFAGVNTANDIIDGMQSNPNNAEVATGATSFVVLGICLILLL